jgi:hypothetical protein
MASRSKAPRRREPDSDSLEALKPLVVLGLLGMILYGAYSIVQKGPSSPPPTLPEAPPFTTGEAAFASPASVAAPQVDLPAPPSTPTAPAAAPVAAIPASQSVSTAAPTYLNAQSAAPPQNADVALADLAPPVTSAVSAVPPAVEPLASSTTASPPEPLQAQGVERSAAPPLPSAAFASAWADAHDKLAAGRYAEALAVLSAWHDDSSLGLEESQRLEELLGQLAGTVIYSQQDLLLPPHVVAPGETLDSIAAGHRVPWQLLAKINGVDDPKRLVPGEAVKLVRGPFDAVVSVSRRRLSLQVAGNYAGVFPVVIGRGVPERIGSSLAVSEIRRDAGLQPSGAAPTATGAFVQQVAGQAGTKSIVLHEGLRIEAADDPAAMSDIAPAGALIVTPRDLDELVDILGEGSHVLIRQ